MKTSSVFLLSLCCGAFSSLVEEESLLSASLQSHIEHKLESSSAATCVQACMHGQVCPDGGECPADGCCDGLGKCDTTICSEGQLCDAPFQPLCENVEFDLTYFSMRTNDIAVKSFRTRHRHTSANYNDVTKTGCCPRNTCDKGSTPCAFSSVEGARKQTECGGVPFLPLCSDDKYNVVDEIQSDYSRLFAKFSFSKDAGCCPTFKCVEGTQACAEHETCSDGTSCLENLGCCPITECESNVRCLPGSGQLCPNGDACPEDACCKADQLGTWCGSATPCRPWLFDAILGNTVQLCPGGEPCPEYGCCEEEVE